jgi:hypothetical protein
VPFLSQPTHFITRVDPDIFDRIAWFYRNKHYFIAYDKLFLEKSLGTHFCQFRFPRVRLVVLQPWKKLAWFHVWKAKFSRFHICHDICIGSSRCRGHHRTLTVWLCDVVELTSSELSTLIWDVPFLSQPTHFITWVADIFDGIILFHRNKCCFVAYDKLFLEKSLGTHFCQFGFP